MSRTQACLDTTSSRIFYQCALHFCRYVRNLQFLVDKYVDHRHSAPARTLVSALQHDFMNRYVTPSRQKNAPRAFAGIDAQQLWSEIDGVLDLNQSFLAQLQTAVAHWDEETSLLGPLILTYATNFRHYAAYAAKHGKAVSVHSPMIIFESHVCNLLPFRSSNAVRRRSCWKLGSARNGASSDMLLR